MSLPYHILILGGGVAGLTTAMTLSKTAPPHLQPKIDIFEIRPEPGTAGGAINLTPNALRLLDYLGVYKIIQERQYGINVNAVEVFSIYHPTKLAESSFRGPHNEGIGSPPYKARMPFLPDFQLPLTFRIQALRITRASLMHALIAALATLPNITLHLDHRATSISETATSVTVDFTTHPSATGDLLLGCDGVHSFTRNHHVDPSRHQIYTGVANAFGFAPLTAADRAAVHFDASALNFARRGLLLTSYYEPTRTSGYVGAIITTPDVGSREGWRMRGADRAAVRRDMFERFGDAVLPAVRAFMDKADDWFLWPVYMVPDGGRGKWATARCMLLGDAAHGMPPQGESTGIVLEDTVLFARCLLVKQQLQHRGGDSVGEAFAAYEALRRDRIDAACKESMAVVHSVTDTGRFGFWLKTCIIPLFLAAGRAKRQKRFEEDVTTCPLRFAEESDREAEPGKAFASGEKALVTSVLARLVAAWRQGGLWRLLRVVAWGRS